MHEMFVEVITNSMNKPNKREANSKLTFKQNLSHPLLMSISQQKKLLEHFDCNILEKKSCVRKECYDEVMFLT